MKYPYNLGTPSQELALKALSNAGEVEKGLRLIKDERARLEDELKKSCMCTDCIPQ